VNVPVNLEGYLALHRGLTDWVMVWSSALVSAGIKPNSLIGTDPRVRQAIAYLQGHLKDADLNGELIASQVGLSLSQLNRQFLRERGETLRQFHQIQRKEHAQHLLMRTSLSIKEIAMELGFFHQSHFTTWFRKQTGATPSAFRLNPVGERFYKNTGFRKRK
jgi:AraC-like DNA-binding protein